MTPRRLQLGTAYTRAAWIVYGRLHWQTCPFTLNWRGQTDPFQPFQFADEPALTAGARERLAVAGLRLETLELLRPAWDQTETGSGYQEVWVTVSRLRRPHERAVQVNRMRAEWRAAAKATERTEIKNLLPLCSP